MSGRKYRRLRAAGQDRPPADLRTTEFLCWGENLINWPEPFPVEEAEAAWQAHRHIVLESWADVWRGFKSQAIPTCWAARCFDGEPQIAANGLDSWTKERIASIEAEVGNFLHLHAA